VVTGRSVVGALLAGEVGVAALVGSGRVREAPREGADAVVVDVAVAGAASAMRGDDTLAGCVAVGEHTVLQEVKGTVAYSVALIAMFGQC
jgi:hypothetical protein